MSRLRLLTLCHVGLWAAVAASGLAAHRAGAVAGHAVLLLLWSVTHHRGDWPDDLHRLANPGVALLTLGKVAVVAGLAVLIHLAGRGIGVALNWQAVMPIWLPLAFGLGAILVGRAVYPPRRLAAMEGLLDEALAAIGTASVGTAPVTDPATRALATGILALPDDTRS